MESKDHYYKLPFAPKVISVTVALILWQILSILVNKSILLVGPIDVMLRLGTIWRESGFWTSIWFTWWHIAAGFMAGVLLGVVFGLLADRYSIVEVLLWPYMLMIRSIPVASIVVICLVWLSASNLSIFISFLIVLPIVYNNVLTGLRNRSEELEEVAGVYGITGTEKIKTVLLPQLAPYLISAASVTAGIAWKAGVAAEVIGTPAGSIGQQLYLSKIYLATDDLLAWTVIIVFISGISEKVFLFILKKCFEKWCGTPE